MGLSFWHILIVALVIVLVFGTNRLPRTMEDLAKGIKAFKKGLKEDDGANAGKKKTRRSRKKA